MARKVAKIALCLTLGVVLIAPRAQAFAKAPKESFCSLIRKTQNGKFRVEIQYGWSLYDASREDGQIAFEPDVVGVTCLRDKPFLVLEDLEALKQGITLTFGARKTAASVEYSLSDGVIAYDVRTGSLSKSQVRKLTKAMAKAQEQL